MNTDFLGRLVTSSPWHFPWKNVEAQFQAENGPHRLHHYLPQGKPLSTTIGAQAEMIVAGHQTSVSQETCSFMYHCYQGHGETSITTPQGEHSVIQWKARDTFAIPAWSKISHRNLSDQDVAYLFAVNDRPLLQHLDLLRHA